MASSAAAPAANAKDARLRLFMWSSLECSLFSFSRRGCSLAGSVLDVSHQPFGADLGAIDVAHRVGGDALGRAGPGRFLDRIGNECRHLSGLGTADANAALPAVVIL